MDDLQFYALLNNRKYKNVFRFRWNIKEINYMYYVELIVLLFGKTNLHLMYYGNRDLKSIWGRLFKALLA